MTDHWQAVINAGCALEQARLDEAAAFENLRLVTLKALADGMTEAEAARLGQVDRMTVRKWRGKR